jgi:hypothetical protein
MSVQVGMYHHELPTHRLYHQLGLLWELDVWTAGWHVAGHCALYAW